MNVFFGADDADFPVVVVVLSGLSVASLTAVKLCNDVAEGRIRGQVDFTVEMDADF